MQTPYYEATRIRNDGSPHVPVIFPPALKGVWKRGSGLYLIFLNFPLSSVSIEGTWPDIPVVSRMKSKVIEFAPIDISFVLALCSHL